MSSNYITVKVSPEAAKAAKIIVLLFAGVGVFIMIISGIFFAMGEMEIATITIIISVSLIMLGIIIYGLIALISSMKTTMSKREISEVTKRMLILIPSSLLLLVILVVLMSL